MFSFIANFFYPKTQHSTKTDEKAPTKIVEINYENEILKKIGASIDLSFGSTKEDSNQKKKFQNLEPSQDIISSKKYFQKKKIEQCSFETHLKNPSFENGFMQAIHYCFTNHLPLEISPDDIWLLITQGISMYEQMTGNLGKEFGLDPKKKKDITIDRSNFKRGKKNDWEGVFPEFVEKIRGNVKEDLFNCIYSEFSCSSKLDKISFAVTIMDSLKEYFNYTVTTFCFIPKIVLTGEKSDWEKIIENLKKIGSYKKLDIKWWTDELIPIIEKFVDAYENETVDRTFWNCIYKYNPPIGSGNSFITGWIQAFFPFRTVTYPQLRVLEVRKRKDWKGFLKNILDGNFFFGKSEEVKFMDCDAVHNGISFAPFKWKYYGRNLKCEFSAGHFGTVKNSRGNFAAKMGWAISYV